ncbi:MAG: hypothetical protein ACTHMI_16025 [Mucilaginibacter sp.]
MNDRHFNYQALFIKWLLAIALLPGVLLFSGATLQAQPNQELSGTEVFYVSKRHAVKSITYQRAIIQVYQLQNRLISFDKPLTVSSRFASLHTKTLNKVYNSRNIGKPYNWFFYQPKITSQQYDDPDIVLI